MLEGYTDARLPRRAHRADAGSALLVTGVTYRHPGLLAKIVTTLDVLSGGRAVLGIGAAWYEREHHGLGVPFPPVAERFERLEETLQICQQMWSDDDGPYEGKHYQLAETLCVPPPSAAASADHDRRQRRAEDAAPRRPVRRRVQPLPGTDVDDGRAQARRAGDHCDNAGRDPAEVARTIFTAKDPVADPDAFRAEVEMLTGLGISMVWTGPPRGIADPVGWVAELLRAAVAGAERSLSR